MISRLGEALRGTDLRAIARQGLEWLGNARLSLTWLGYARFGLGCMVRPVLVRIGKALHGLAGPGLVWPVMVGRGVAGCGEFQC
jgi:hypothetical protein